MHVYSYLKHSMYCYWLDQALLVEKLTTVYKAISTTVIWSDNGISNHETIFLI